ncbi:hypothetical protein ACBA38_002832 [Vibrio alginolyticus]
MEMKHIKIITMAVGGVLIAALSFILGISFGVSFNQNSLIEIVIPALSALGSWVAGLGTLGAVFTSLWLAVQQKKENAEKLRNLFDVFVFPPDLRPRLAVNITCLGNKPSHINSLTIHSADCNIAMMIAKLDFTGNQLPMIVSYGQQATFVLPLDSEISIRKYVQKNCSGSYKRLVLNVNTSTTTFKIPFNEKVIAHLQKDSAIKGAKSDSQRPAVSV